MFSNKLIGVVSSPIFRAFLRLPYRRTPRDDSQVNFGPFPRNCSSLKTYAATWAKREDGKSESGRPSDEDDASQAEEGTANLIFLMDMDDKPLGNMTYDKAHKLAHKKNLKLVKIEDPVRRTKCDVYRLMTGVRLHEERLKLRDAKTPSNKGEKTLIVSWKISDHDVEVKAKTIGRWLDAGHNVRVTINGDGKNAPSMERIFEQFQKATLEAGSQVLQKRTSEDLKTMKFSLQMVSKKKSTKLKSTKLPDATNEVTPTEYDEDHRTKSE